MLGLTQNIHMEFVCLQHGITNSFGIGARIVSITMVGVVWKSNKYLIHMLTLHILCVGG
jgi:hypothetical protein